MSIRTARAASSRLAPSAVWAAAACLLATVAHAEPAKGPLERLLESETDSLCFRRDYDAAHLKRVPGQLTQSVVLSFKADEVLIMLRQQGGERYITASCEYRQGAGYDTSGRLQSMPTAPCSGGHGARPRRQPTGSEQAPPRSSRGASFCPCYDSACRSLPAGDRKSSFEACPA